eukprot:COSAG02_NODE_38883_length_423_cov_1.981481_1_plen_63_part_10
MRMLRARARARGPLLTCWRARSLARALAHAGWPMTLPRVGQPARVWNEPASMALLLQAQRGSL